MSDICVHVMDIDNYFTELKELTLSTIERFCDNIKANLDIINERKYQNWLVFI